MSSILNLGPRGNDHSRSPIPASESGSVSESHPVSESGSVLPTEEQPQPIEDQDPFTMLQNEWTSTMSSLAVEAMSGTLNSTTLNNVLGPNHLLL